MNNGSTRDKIVELARDLIQRLGYHSFNYKQIADELHIKNASIHHYFPAKEDLGLAVIEKDKSDFTTLSKGWDNYAPPERIEFLIKVYDQYYKDGMKLCVVGSFGSSYQNIPQKVKSATATYSHQITTWLIKTFNEGLESGDFKFQGTAEEMTAGWVSGLTGALQVGRIRGTSYFEGALNHLRNSIK